MYDIFLKNNKLLNITKNFNNDNNLKINEVHAT
jgi:hypothetical protein